MEPTARLAAGCDCLLGCWLIAAPFAVAAPGVARWNDVLVGTAVAFVAGYNYARLRAGRPATAIGAGLVAILGGWLVVAPFVLGHGLEDPIPRADVVAGTMIASFGSYNAYVATDAGREPAGRLTAG